MTDAVNASTVNAVELSANATSIAVPRARLSATTIGFGNTLYIGSAPPQTVTLTSAGTAPLDVASIVATGNFV